MSSNISLLPRKWFAVAAALSLLLAVIAAVALWPRPQRRTLLALGGASASLRQLDENGMHIPWGASVSGEFVRIEVDVADPQQAGNIELRLSRDGAEPSQLESDGAGADLTRLAPGRYRWSAVVHAPDGKAAVLEPPRGDSQAADFVVAPPVLELPLLRQRTLSGEEIERGAQTKGGALLGAAFTKSPLPGAVLEIEVKPPTAEFDGQGVYAIAVHSGDVSAAFVGPEGPYHWRARVVVSAKLSSPWRAFAAGQTADFVVVGSVPTAPAPPPHESDTTGKKGPTGDNVGGLPVKAGPGAKGKGKGGATPDPRDPTGDVAKGDPEKDSGGTPKDGGAGGNPKKGLPGKNGGGVPTKKGPNSPTDPGESPGNEKGSETSGKKGGGAKAKDGSAGKGPGGEKGKGDPDSGKDSDSSKENGKDGPGDKKEQSGKGKTGHGSYASGVGGGHRQPLPSRLRPLASLWLRAFWRIGLILGVITTLVALLLVVARVTNRLRHGASKRS